MCGKFKEWIPKNPHIPIPSNVTFYGKRDSADSLRTWDVETVLDNPGEPSIVVKVGGSQENMRPQEERHREKRTEEAVLPVSMRDIF